MNKLHFLRSKLTNMVDWLITSEILAKDHRLIDYLCKAINDENYFMTMLDKLSYYADEQGVISEYYQTLFLASFDRKISDFMEDDKDKFNKYLKLFVEIYRRD